MFHRVLSAPFILRHSHCTIRTVPFTLYHSHCTNHIVPITLYHSHCTNHIEPFTLHHSHCTIHIVPFTLHQSHCTIYIVPFTLHQSHCIIHIVPFTVFSASDNYFHSLHWYCYVILLYLAPWPSCQLMLTYWSGDQPISKMRKLYLQEFYEHFTGSKTKRYSIPEKDYL